MPQAETPRASSAARRSSVAIWLSVAAFWGFVSALYAGQLWWLSQRAGERINLRSALVWQCGYYLLWIPFTPLVWRVTRNWLPERLGWARWLAAHVGFAAAVAAAHTAAVAAVVAPLAGERGGVLIVFLMNLRGRFHLEFLVYAAVSGMGQAIELHERYRERRVAAARLEAELSSARLDALRAQLQPHFLFNSLHSIASLARAGDNAGVVRLIAGLSELLRHVLDTNGQHRPLADEMRLVDQYLDIQRVRFGDRLTTRVTLDPAAAAARVPPLVVQPLVENALRHGLAPRVEAGSLAVRAWRDGDWTAIQVEDDGAGLPEGWSLDTTNGTGLRNLSSRLAGEFGPRQSFTLEPRAGGGVLATVRLPFIAT